MNASRTPSTAFLLELLGYLGILGVGHVYSGNVGLGIGIMLFWFMFLLGSAFLVTITGGFAACCLAPVVLLAPAASAAIAYEQLEKQNITV